MKSAKAIIKNLPNGVGIVRNNTDGRHYFQVRLGKKFTGGPIIRKKFGTVKEAREWIFGPESTNPGPSKAESSKFKTEPGSVITLKERAGGAAFALSAAQINEAAAAFRVLEGQKKSLTEAVAYFIKYAIPVSGEKTLADAIKTLCEIKRTDRKNEKYIKGLEWSLGKFATEFKNIHVHEVTRDNLETWLKKKAFRDQTRRNYIRDLGILFNFAVDRGWTSSSPMNGIDRPSVKTGKTIVLSTHQVEAILNATPTEIRAAIAIKLFAGVRTSELLKLEWSDINEERIVIEAEKAKTRQRRVIMLSENLVEWLKPFFKPAGRVAPFSPRQWHERVKLVATAAKVAPLPKNCFRHSFCSYHLGKHRNENLTAAEAGNSATIIHSHYHELITKKEQIDAYWAIKPKEEPAK